MSDVLNVNINKMSTIMTVFCLHVDVSVITDLFNFKDMTGARWFRRCFFRTF